jgi:HAMP domain-containing protein
MADPVERLKRVEAQLYENEVVLRAAARVSQPRSSALASLCDELATTTAALRVQVRTAAEEIEQLKL